MQKSKTGKISIFSSLDIKLKFLTSRIELTQFSVESSRVKLKIWATRLRIESNSKCQFETRLDDQSNDYKSWKMKRSLFAVTDLHSSALNCFLLTHEQRNWKMFLWFSVKKSIFLSNWYVRKSFFHINQEKTHQIYLLPLMLMIK